MSKTFILAVCLFTAAIAESNSQELQANVQVLSPQIQATNKRPIIALQEAIANFLNTTKWTALSVTVQERIACTFVITVREWDGNARFVADAQIVSTRPVYASSYQSPILTINDQDFNFTYIEGDPLDFSQQQYLNNLSSLLAFYAYTIIGLDADSFSLNGGDSYYVHAQSIVNNAQNSSFRGWKAMENLRNRWWLVDNLRNVNFAPARKFSYIYHLQGLDRMSQHPEDARKVILDALPTLLEIEANQQGAIYNQLFYAAKSDELVGIFSASKLSDRTKALNLLSLIDPGNAHKYATLKEQ